MREGWREVAIGEVSEVVNGGTPKTGVAEFWGGPHRWITPAEMGGLSQPYVSETARLITDSGLQNSSARLLPPHSLVLSSRAPIGYVVINAEPMAFNQGCKGLIPNPEVDHKYLFYFLTSAVELLNELGTGATFKELSGGKLKTVRLPLPPLPEQKRIVAILDEAFAGIDRAIANTEKNLANARELFESYLNAVFSRKGEGWVEKDINGLSEIAYGYTAPASSAPVGPKFLRITDIRDNSVDWESVPYCTISEDDHAKHQLLDGDIVFARTGATTGKSYLLVSPPDAVCASYLIRLRVLSEIVRPAFMRYFFRTSAYWNVIASGTAGSAQGGFNATKLSGLVVPFPESLVEQDRIVLETQQLSELASGIENQCLTKLSALSTLKQSLLQKAFSGELTAKEADRVMAGA